MHGSQVTKVTRAGWWPWGEVGHVQAGSEVLPGHSVSGCWENPQSRLDLPVLALAMLLQFRNGLPDRPWLGLGGRTRQRQLGPGEVLCPLRPRQRTHATMGNSPAPCRWWDAAIRSTGISVFSLLSV